MDLENKFEGEREYSESTNKFSNNTNKQVVMVNKKNRGKGFVIFVFILVIILVTSLVSSLVTLYVAPNLPFFSNTPLYSKVLNNGELKYVGPTYFKEEEGALSITEVVQRVGPAVVGVSTQSIVDRGFFGLQQQEGVGSGFIINEEGHILTNYHVVEGAQTVKVVFYDGVETDAKVVNYDEANDIALLKISDSSVIVPATVALGNSDELLVGESVVAIGSPLGIEFLGTTTNGIISALDRDITIEGKTLKLLQTNAAINPGNSGGPLINSKGEVIGINTAKYGSNSSTNIEGIGFAIPINQAKQKLDELSKPIIRIGIKGRVISSDMSKNLNLPEGVYVVDVDEFSNAEKAGIRAGDVIVKFGGVNVKTFDDINQVKSNHQLGDTIEVVVYRDGSQRTISLTLNE